MDLAEEERLGKRADALLRLLLPRNRLADSHQLSDYLAHYAPPAMRSLALLSTVIVIALAGCGGSSHAKVNPEAMLSSAGAHPITSAQAEIDLQMQVEGVSQLSGPVKLRFEGPYVSGGGDRIPSFDWRFTASALGFPVGGRAVSTGSNAYLTVYGDNYEIGTAAVSSANQRVGQFALSPGSWFGRARIDGEGHEGGADCERIAAPLRGAAVARDLAPLADEMGLSPPTAISGSAKACVGFDDRFFHEIGVDADLAVPAADRARLGGATAIHLTLDVVNSDIGEPQQISKPGGGGYRPIRDLALSLNDLGVPIPL